MKFVENNRMNAEIERLDRLNIYIRTAVKILRGGGKTLVFKASKRPFHCR